MFNARHVDLLKSVGVGLPNRVARPEVWSGLGAGNFSPAVVVWTRDLVRLLSRNARPLVVILLLVAVLGACCSGRSGFQSVKEQAPAEVLLNEFSPKSAETEREFAGELKFVLGGGGVPAFCSVLLLWSLDDSSSFCCRRLLGRCSRGPPQGDSFGMCCRGVQS